MVLEIVKAQAEADAAVGVNNFSEFVEVSRLAVRGEAHHFVFVAEFPEAEVLRNRGVIHAERMRKGNGPIDMHAIAAAGTPHGAGEISKAVSGKQRGFIEWRYEECAGEMRLVMLDAVILGLNF